MKYGSAVAAIGDNIGIARGAWSNFRGPSRVVIISESGRPYKADLQYGVLDESGIPHDILTLIEHWVASDEDIAATDWMTVVLP